VVVLHFKFSIKSNLNFEHGGYVINFINDDPQFKINKFFIFL